MPCRVYSQRVSPPTIPQKTLPVVTPIEHVRPRGLMFEYVSSAALVARTESFSCLFFFVLSRAE